MTIRSERTRLGRSGRQRLIPSIVRTSRGDASASFVTTWRYVGSAMAWAANRAYQLGVPSACR